MILTLFLLNFTSQFAQAQVPGAAPTTTSSSSSSSSKDGITDEVLALRDPFKMPRIALEKLSPKNELELVSLEDLKLLGVITGPGPIRAILQAPSQKTYIVAEKMKLGNKKGVVTKITPDQIEVREKEINVLGREHAIISHVLLPEESKEVKIKGSNGSARSGGPGGLEVPTTPGIPDQNNVPVATQAGP